MSDAIEQLITNLDVDARQIQRQDPEPFTKSRLREWQYAIVREALQQSRIAVYVPRHFGKGMMADELRRQSSPETSTRSLGAGPMSTANIRDINPKLIGGRR